MNDSTDKITQALEAGEKACEVLQKALAERDATQAPALAFEALAVTLEALALCARSEKLNPIENLLPNAVHYVRIIQTLNTDLFHLASRLSIGSTIGVGDDK